MRRLSFNHCVARATIEEAAKFADVLTVVFQKERAKEALLKRSANMLSEEGTVACNIAFIGLAGLGTACYHQSTQVYGIARANLQNTKVRGVRRG